MEIKIETIIYGIPDEKNGGTRSLERRIGTDLYWPRVVGGICARECEEVCNELE